MSRTLRFFLFVLSLTHTTLKAHETVNVAPGIDLCYPLPTNVKSRCVFVFDLHGVLSSLHMWEAIWYVLQTSCSSWHDCLETTRFFLTLGWKELLKPETKRHRCGEGMIAEIIENDNAFAPFFHRFCAVANLQYVHPMMLEVVQELKEQGHILLIASNIGSKTLQIARQDSPLSELFSFFDGYIYSYQGDDGCYITKPNPLFFEHILHAIQKITQGIPPRSILLIDDSSSNHEMCIRMGLPAYLFENIVKLRKHLQDHYRPFHVCKNIFT